MVDTIEGRIRVGGTDKDLDTTIVTQSDTKPAHRETVVIGDPADNDARLDVKKDINTGEYQLLTQDKQIQVVCDLLSEMVQLQKETNMLLKGILQ